ncbi:MAG: hypothetical protein QXT92_01040, partial [Nitrososphaerota archaeon]
YFPSALSSIFSPKIRIDVHGVESHFDNIGARGGGFSLVEGCETWVKIDEDEENETEVVVNDSIKYFPPSLEAAEEMRRRFNITGKIEIRHRIHVPLATGFGSSASSIAGTVLALSTLTGHDLTLRGILKITHEIELKCRTGLNSEAGFITGGLVLVLREGAPPKTIVDSIPLPQDIKLVALVARSMKTSEVISDFSKIEYIEEVGDKFLSRILKKPTPQNFLTCAKEFAYEAGFVTSRVEEMFEVLRRLPIVGYAQNMLGEAAHTLIYERDLEYVLKELRDYFQNERIVVSDLTSTCNVSSKQIVLEKSVS